MGRVSRHRISSDEEGCWLDNHRGVYMGQGIMDEAKSRGYKGRTMVYDREEKRYRQLGPDDGENYHYWTECAEEYLQKLAPDGYWIGTSEQGDFGMWRIEEED